MKVVAYSIHLCYIDRNHLIGATMWTVKTWYRDSDLVEVTYFIKQTLSYVLDHVNWKRHDADVLKIEITGDELAITK